MGQDKNRNSASKLARFLLFFCQSQLAGSNPSQSEKSVVRFSKNDFAVHDFARKS
jgi:hypothetical protein